MLSRPMCGSSSRLACSLAKRIRAACSCCRTGAGACTASASFLERAARLNGVAFMLGFAQQDACWGARRLRRLPCAAALRVWRSSSRTARASRCRGRSREIGSTAAIAPGTPRVRAARVRGAGGAADGGLPMMHGQQEQGRAAGARRVPCAMLAVGLLMGATARCCSACCQERGRRRRGPRLTRAPLIVRALDAAQSARPRRRLASWHSHRTKESPWNGCRRTGSSFSSRWHSSPCICSAMAATEGTAGMGGTTATGATVATRLRGAAGTVTERGAR